MVGWVVDGIAKGSLDSATLTGYLAGLFGLGLLIYLLRYVWRVMLFGASIGSPMCCATGCSATSPA